MNKQELMKRMHEAGVNCKAIKYASQFDKGYNNGIAYAINLLDKLDEPEKPIVPQFVADWYEKNKYDFEYNLYRLCIDFYEQKLHEDLHEWFNNDKNKPIEVLVLMDKYDYEVEKEKLYTVELPNSNYQGSGHFVLHKDEKGKVFIDWHYSENWKKLDGVELTESEIKEDYDWAWKFAEEVKE